MIEEAEWPTYRVSQYFIQVAPGLAHNATQQVLTQTAASFPSLVYAL